LRAISSDIARKWVQVAVGGSAAYLIAQATSAGNGDGSPAAFAAQWANGGASIGLVSAWLHTPVTVYGPVAGELRADAPAGASVLYFDILHV